MRLMRMVWDVQRGFRGVGVFSPGWGYTPTAVLFTPKLGVELSRKHHQKGFSPPLTHRFTDQKLQSTVMEQVVTAVRSAVLLGQKAR
jgi:hypothetical protein